MVNSVFYSRSKGFEHVILLQFGKTNIQLSDFDILDVNVLAVTVVEVFH